VRNSARKSQSNYEYLRKCIHFERRTCNLLVFMLTVIKKYFLPSGMHEKNVYRVILIINYCPIAVGIENPNKVWMCRQPFFCSTLSEFENFLLCERILINVTTCQNETSS
jgi:hypothetical protein